MSRDLKETHSFILKEEKGGFTYLDKESKMPTVLNINLILRYMKQEKYRVNLIYKDKEVVIWDKKHCMDVWHRSDGEYKWTDIDIFMLEMIYFDMNKDFIIKVRDSYTAEELYNEYKGRIGRYVVDSISGKDIYVNNVTDDLYFEGIGDDGNSIRISSKNVFKCADSICRKIILE